MRGFVLFCLTCFFPHLVSWTFYVIASEKENIQKAEKTIYPWHWNFQRKKKNSDRNHRFGRTPEGKQHVLPTPPFQRLHQVFPNLRGKEDGQRESKRVRCQRGSWRKGARTLPSPGRQQEAGRKGLLIVQGSEAASGFIQA